MSTYYKILPRRYAEDLVHKGEVKIKTLYECRAAEDVAGKGRSDREEGVVGHNMTMASFRQLTPEEEKDEELLVQLYMRGYRLDRWWLSHGEKMLVRVAEETFIRPGLDRYVLCVSREQTRKSELNLWEPLAELCWVEIFDGERFFAALNSRMAALGHVPLGVRDIVYRSRLFLAGEDATSDPPWIKPTAFEHEHETRAVWRPATLPVHWFVVKEPELSACCRIQRRVEPPNGS